jgi:hypothetical protein
MKERAVETTDGASVEKAFSASQVGNLKNEDLGKIEGPAIPTVNGRMPARASRHLDLRQQR